jgi:hypothetical protein
MIADCKEKPLNRKEKTLRSGKLLASYRKDRLSENAHLNCFFKSCDGPLMGESRPVRNVSPNPQMMQFSNIDETESREISW